MLWIFLSIGVAFLKALSELTGKVFMDPNGKNTLDEYSLALWIRSIVIIPVFLFCLWEWLRLDIWPHLLVILSGWFFSALATITALKAMKYWELSIIGPLWSLTTPLILVTAFFITREVPNVYGILWVLIVFMGTYFLWIDGNKKDVLLPMKNIFSDIGARYMLVTTVLWSLTAPIDKLWVQWLGIFHWLLYLNIATALFILVYVSLIWKKVDIKKVYSKKNLKKICTLAFVMWLANIIQLFALKYTLVVYVIAIKRASWVFSVLLWAIFFQEKNILWKLCAVSFMIIWVIFIVLYGNI